MIYSKNFVDGIAFYTDEERTLETKIAFYSKITNTIRYSTIYLGISKISYEDNLQIMETIMMDKEKEAYMIIKNLATIIKEKNFTIETLTAEAKHVREYGDWTIPCLMGYTADMLDNAVKNMKQTQLNNWLHTWKK